MQVFLDCPSRRREFLKTPDGVNISVREWGNPAGRPIVFIHGIAQCHLAFAKQLSSPDMAGYRLVAFDTRGHGESDKPADAIFYQDYRRWADEVQTVIDGMKLDRPILAGWSMGGRIIGQYLTVYGDAHISGIHLISARVVADARFSALGFPVPDPTQAPGLATDISWAMAFVRACFHRQPPPDEFAVVLAYNMICGSGIQHAIRGWGPRIDETTAALKEVKVPTLITHGAMDAVVLLTAAQFAHEHIAGSQLSVYPDCGHSPFWEEPQRFNRELAAFAGRVFNSGI